MANAAVASSAAAAAAGAAVSAKPQPKPLELYTPRRPLPPEEKVHSWLAFKPPIPPSWVEVDASVKAMKSKFQLKSVSRPDDPKADPKEIEEFHITICAVVNDPETNVKLIEEMIRKEGFTTDDLYPTLDPTTGVHVHFEKEKGDTVYSIFRYTQSDRMRVFRAHTAAQFCDIAKYTVVNAHVTAAYGKLKDTKPAAAAPAATTKPAAAAAAGAPGPKLPAAAADAATPMATDA